MMNTAKKEVYFPGLNGLRAIAALTVVFCHIDLFTYLFGLKELGFSNNNADEHAVTLFFVLSGFLITNLLLREKDSYKKIDIKKFYIRRTLRIWPLYYIIIFLTLALSKYFPTIQYDKTTLAPAITLFTLLMANISYTLYYFTTLSPLWSIGVEEQFYLMWPWVVEWTDNLPVFLSSFIGIYIVITYGIRFFSHGTLYSLIRLTSFDCMGFGAMTAFLYHNNSKYLKYLYFHLTQWAAILLVVVPTIFYKVFYMPQTFQPEYYGILFSIIILNISTNKKSILRLNNVVLEYLGKISYGIYMFHMIVLSVISYLIRPYLINLNPSYAYTFMYLSVVLVTIAVSSLSFFYFESYILKFKTKFALVKSSNIK